MEAVAVFRFFCRTLLDHCSNLGNSYSSVDDVDIRINGRWVAHRRVKLDFLLRLDFLAFNNAFSSGTFWVDVQFKGYFFLPIRKSRSVPKGYDTVAMAAQMFFP